MYYPLCIPWVDKKIYLYLDSPSQFRDTDTDVTYNRRLIVAECKLLLLCIVVASSYINHNFIRDMYNDCCMNHVRAH